MNLNKGFTLIELLVAVTIVIILTAFGVSNYAVAIAKSRDSRRQTDLANLQSALEMYRDDERVYPSSLPACGQSLTGTKTGTVYLKEVPCDPSTKALYIYKPDAKFYNYTLTATMETRKDSNCSPSVANTYCVSNP